MVRSTLFLFVSLSIIIFVSSCSSVNYLSPEEIENRKYKTPPKSSELIYYDQKVTVDEKGKIFQRTHIVVQTSLDKLSLNSLLSVYENPTNPLTSFGARVIHKDGSEKKYDASRLVKINLSNAEEMNESSVKMLSIADDIQPGDLVEMISENENTMPGLGFEFSLERFEKKIKYANLSFEFPKEKEIKYWVYNDSIVPQISFDDKTNRKTISFNWKDYTQPEAAKGVFRNYNYEPIILATLPMENLKNDSKIITNWNQFGDWYLNLIQHRLEGSESIKWLADSISKNGQTNLEKLDLIFEYCKSKIRYEQVYLKNGEFIPNEFNTILSRKYGDCKDYSLVIHTLAKSIGINTNLVLCYRGRGNEFYTETPVSQFNHMIVNYSENGNQYWYDGTNRKGIERITTSDLINQYALILENSNSRLEKIEASDKNLLEIKGDFYNLTTKLNGTFEINFHSQYAVDFNYGSTYLNNEEFKNYLTRWLKGNINGNITYKKLEWKSTKELFQVKCEVEIPNVFIKIDTTNYSSLDRIFSDLLPSKTISDKKKDVFFYPDFQNVSIELNLDNMSRLTENNASVHHWNLKYSLPAGPFSDSEKNAFIENYKNLTTRFTNKEKFVRN